MVLQALPCHFKYYDIATLHRTLMMKYAHTILTNNTNMLITGDACCIM